MGGGPVIAIWAAALAADLSIVELEPTPLEPDPGWTVVVPDGRIVDTHSFAYLVGDTETFERLSAERRKALGVGLPLLTLGLGSLATGVYLVQEADGDLTGTRRGRWAAAGGAIGMGIGAVRIGGTWGAQWEVQAEYSREEAEAWISRSR